MVFSKNKANDVSVKLNEITVTKVKYLEWHCTAGNGFHCLITTDFQDRVDVDVLQ